MKFQKRKPRWNLEKLLVQQQKAQDALEEKLGAVKCESGSVEVQRKSIKKCVLDRLAMSDLVGKVDSRARKPWITHEVIGKMDEQRKRRNDNNKELQNNRKLRNKWKRTTDKAKKEYLESTSDKIVEF